MLIPKRNHCKYDGLQMNYKLSSGKFPWNNEIENWSFHAQKDWNNLRKETMWCYFSVFPKSFLKEENWLIQENVKGQVYFL